MSALESIKYFFGILQKPDQRKHAIKWFFSRIPGYLLATGTPWIVFDAIDQLNHSLPSKPKVFEYGSGASTMFWLRHGASLTSVEHDPLWFRKIEKRVKRRSDVDYRLVEPVFKDNTLIDYANPHNYSTEDKSLRNYDFRNYASQIDEFPDKYFDVVFIDGRSRPACIMHGSRKVKHGGLLILDNANREYYTAQTSAYLQDFICKEYYGITPVGYELSQTNFYIRNSV